MLHRSHRPGEKLVHSIFPSAAAARRWACTAPLVANTAVRACDAGDMLLSPNSDGMYRLTPAATAASTNLYCSATPAVAMVLSTTSCPRKAAVRASAGYASSIVTTRTPPGSLDFEEARWRAVMLKDGSARRALRMMLPKDPIAPTKRTVLKADMFSVFSESLYTSRGRDVICGYGNCSRDES